MQLGRVPGLRQAPRLLHRTRDDVVVFDSWWGLYSDSPRAIAEAVRRMRPDLREVWTAKPGMDPPIPDGAERVEFGSAAHLGALARAGHLIANTHLPNHMTLGRRGVWVQTWHGTPLKRIGNDMPRPELPRRDVDRWDVLLSPNPFSTEIFRRAFGYDGRILETGYPRNDILRSPDAPRLRAKVRSQLALPDDTLAVLYAPTWRDTHDFELGLDLDVLREDLPAGTTLLLRIHPSLDYRLPEGHGLPIVEVPEPDPGELFLAADVLVTDYSSVMFDFAVTGKPMVFYAYDLARYRDEMRGFYFDLEREGPGPLTTTTAELCQALAGLPAAAAEHADVYARFVERFCPLDDGHASERVVEALFPA